MIISEKELYSILKDYIIMDVYPNLIFNDYLFVHDNGIIKNLPLNTTRYCMYKGINFILIEDERVGLIDIIQTDESLIQWKHKQLQVLN